MFIKLKIEGELLELLQEDADESVRTCTQQAMYIIKSYYKEGIKKNNCIRFDAVDEQILTNSSNNERKGNESVNTEPKEPIVTNEESENNIGNEEFIDEEIYNF